MPANQHEVMTTLDRTRVHAPVDRRIGTLMGFVAATLAVGAFVHLAGYTPGGTRPPFDASHAGIAEAIIGLVLAYGAISVRRAVPRARTVALVTTSLAIVGFVNGLNITARGGDVPDVIYHVTMLPVLVASLILIVRTGRDPRLP
jgi:peptidoglycan/LPS O-acetylase OafA/YrhL